MTVEQIKTLRVIADRLRLQPDYRGIAAELDRIANADATMLLLATESLLNRPGALREALGEPQ